MPTTQSSSRYWMCALAIVSLLGVIGWLVYKAARTDGGAPLYPLDDAYIHLTIAKNLAQHGSWSLSGTGIQGASSSPLWTLLLAATYFTGLTLEWAPLALNIGFGVLVMIAVFWAGARRQWPALWTLCVALAIVFWVPLYVIVFSGMEQVLHILTSLLLMVCAGEYLARGKPIDGDNVSRKEKLLWGLMVLSFLAMGARYESCFLIFIICVLLAIQRRWRPAIGICLAGIAPLVAYAIFSISQGELLFPNSVLIKGVVGEANTDGMEFWGLLQKLTLLRPFFYLVWQRSNFILPSGFHLTLLFLATGAVYFLGRRAKSTASAAAASAPTQAAKSAAWNDGGYLLVMFVVTAWLHLDLSIIGYYFRYDAYLIVLGLFTLGALVAPLLPRAGEVFRGLKALPRKPAWFAGVAVFAMAAFMSARALRATLVSPMASACVYEQQYQVARFLEEYYPGQPVAIHDIGAISYFSDTKVIDLIGLASFEITNDKLHRRFNTETIDKICRRDGARLAVVFAGAFQRFGGLPNTWVPIATWTLPFSYTVGPPTITFYAVDRAQAQDVHDNLRKYAFQLPKDEIVNWLISPPESEFYPIPGETPRRNGANAPVPQSPPRGLDSIQSQERGG